MVTDQLEAAITGNNAPAPLLYKPDGTVLKYMSDTFTDFDKDYQDRVKGWDRWNAMWRGVFYDGSAKNTDGVFHASKEEPSHKSRLYVNQTKQAIVTAVSNVMSILFQEPIPFDVRGRVSKLDDASAELILKTVWYFMHQSGFPVQARRYITTAAIYGTAWGKVYMDQLRDARIDVQPSYDMFGNVLGSKRVPNVRIWPMIRFSAVDLYDMWIDPEVDHTLSFGRGKFHRVYRSSQYIQEKIQSKKFRAIDMRLLELDPKSVTDSNRDSRRTIEGLQILKRTEIPLYDFWGGVPSEVAADAGIEALPDEKLVPVHFVMLGDRSNKMSECLLAERSPLPANADPFLHDLWEDVGHGVYGRGIPEDTHGPQMALNVTVNTRLDNKASGIQQILGVNQDGIDDDADLQFKQNWIIRCRGNPRDILLPITVPDMTASAPAEAEYFERLIEEASGMTKFVQGTESYGSNRTASGINQVYQAASKLMRDITYQFEQNLIAGTARLVYQHALLFLPDEFLIQVTGEQQAPAMRQMVLKDLAVDVMFIASGVTGLQQKETELNQLIQFAQATANPVDAQIVNRQLLIKNIYKRLGFKDADEVVPTPQTPTAPGQPQGVPPTAAPQGPPNIADILSRVAGQARGQG